LRIFNALVTAKSRITYPTEFWRMPWDEVKVDDGLEYLQSLSPEERAEEAREFINRIGW
jgi:hypothetical protein